MGLVTSYHQLLALRFCLGLFESGLFPGLNFFLTGWYRREEINKRCSIFFAGAVLAGAFGGIFGCKAVMNLVSIQLTLVDALSRMNGKGGKEGWSWIVSLPLLKCASELTLAVHHGRNSHPSRRGRLHLDGSRLARPGTLPHPT